MVAPTESTGSTLSHDRQVQGFSAKMKAYIALTRMDKPVGSLLLLWPALWGLLLALDTGWPSIKNLIIFTLGTFLMRSAGCAINDFADRRIDGHVARTQTRPLAQGLIKPREAIYVAAFCALLSFILVLMTNTLTIELSFAGALFAALYPFTKRWISSPQIMLGIAFAWAIPMGFAAEVGQVSLFAWILFSISLLWIVSYDTYYAMADMEFDKSLAIGSTALLFGRYAGQISLLLNLLFLVAFYSITGMSMIFLMLAIVLALYQYWLAKDVDPALCIKAFKLNNLTGLILTLGIVFL